MTTLSPVVLDWEETRVGDLLERARSGDAEAFCELCRAHESGLLRQALALCGNPTVAEDLAQDTLVEAWKSLHRYNGRCRLFTWLCAILMNRYRNLLRSQRPAPFPLFRADTEEVPNGTELAAAQEASPDQEAESREHAALVRKWVEALPPKHQQVVQLRFFVEDTIEGIAAALDCSVGTVKSRLFHALEKLRGMKEVALFRREHFSDLERRID